MDPLASSPHIETTPVPITPEQAVTKVETLMPTPLAAPKTSSPQAPQLDPTQAAAAVQATPVAIQPATVATPTLAADEDVIEPEWVAKTEEIIDQTAGNPFAEEEAIEVLQIDYLHKRYGHDVQKSDGA